MVKGMKILADYISHKGSVFVIFNSQNSVRIKTTQFLYMVKYFSRQLTKEDVQKANKHIKR